METIDAVSRLIASYKKLPGIGNKTAERLAYATLSFTPEELQDFMDSLANVKEHVHSCPKCGMKIDTPFCPICDDEKRDGTTLMVVNDAKNVLSIEKTEKYDGKYFVLGGVLSPVKGIGPEQLRLPELKKRVSEEKIQEVILACASTLEGELTARYIAGYLNDLPVKVTHLAYGLPVGADLEYVDELTIEKSLKARIDMKKEGE
jgi:recombination protein RecR